MNTDDQSSGMAASPENRRSFWDMPVHRRRRDRGAVYTRFVRGMRLLLPLIAVGVVGLLVAWPRVEERMEPVPLESLSPEQKVGTNELINPHFESEDSNRNPFTLTATRAVQSQEDPDLVLLDAPHAKMKTKEGADLAGQSLKGTYRKNEEILLLDGDVRLMDDKGYVMTTSRMVINVKQQKAASDQPVQGEGPAGTLEATGLRLDNSTGHLVFTGPATLILKDSPKASP